MQMQAIPRTSTKLALSTARLPLTVLERAAGHTGDESWPPALAFESLEANVKQIIGSIVRDDVLVDEGRTMEARVIELREANRLEALAERERATANQEFTQRRDADRRKEQEAERRAQNRRSTAERQKAEETARAESQVRDQERRARQAETAREKQIGKQERGARSQAISKEKTALEKEKAAARAKAEVIDTDKELRAAKRQRGSKSA